MTTPGVVISESLGFSKNARQHFSKLTLSNILPVDEACVFVASASTGFEKSLILFSGKQKWSIHNSTDKFTNNLNKYSNAASLFH